MEPMAEANILPLVIYGLYTQQGQLYISRSEQAPGSGFNPHDKNTTIALIVVFWDLVGAINKQILKDHINNL